MGEGGPKQGHEAVAQHLIHRALIAMHRLHQPLEHGVEELPRLLGIPVGQQLQRALEVGKQHRDPLAFAFEHAAGGQDLLG